VLHLPVTQGPHGSPLRVALLEQAARGARWQRWWGHGVHPARGGGAGTDRRSRGCAGVGECRPAL